MDAAKIQLSTDELALVRDAEILLTKNNIISKVYALFGEIAGRVRDIAESQWRDLPADVLSISPKISKGENYDGLPWVMLDYPRLFGREDIFALRLFFWWGNYFSLTLHLKGKYLDLYGKKLEKNIHLLGEKGFYLSVGMNEWRHEITEEHYISLSQPQPISSAGRLSGNDFCKLSVRISLEQWNEVISLA